MSEDLHEPEKAGGQPRSAQDILDVFSQERSRLRRLVEARLDQRLRGRVDPSDILQDVFLDVSNRTEGFLQNPAVPCYVWFRELALQRVAIAYRHHLGTQMRDARREWSLDACDSASLTGHLAERLASRLSSPSSAVNRVERRATVQDALTQLEPIDRDVLVLRHFEDLTNVEIAAVLGLSTRAASNRYVRALVRLRQLLDLTD